jgi:hypothetical protein
MTDPTISASELAMAREIAEQTVPDGFFSVHVMTLAFREVAEKSALAAIRATTERAAVHHDEERRRLYSTYERLTASFEAGLRSEYAGWMRIHQQSATALRAGQHLESTI